MRRALAVAALVLTLAGCGWRGVGVVVEKYRVPPSSSVTCVPMGKGGMVCTPHYYPERFELRVRDSAGDVHNVSVRRDYWDRAQAGDRFSNEEER